MSTEQFFKTKLVKGTVEVEYNSEDNRVYVYIKTPYFQSLYLNYDELESWIQLLSELKTEVDNHG